MLKKLQKAYFFFSYPYSDIKMCNDVHVSEGLCCTHVIKIFKYPSESEQFFDISECMLNIKRASVMYSSLQNINTHLLT